MPIDDAIFTLKTDGFRVSHGTAVLESDEWTLISYFDTGLPDSALTGNIATLS